MSVTKERVLSSSSSSSITSPTSSSAVIGHGNVATDARERLWSGATELERALISCCCSSAVAVTEDTTPSSTTYYSTTTTIATIPNALGDTIVSNHEESSVSNHNLQNCNIHTNDDHKNNTAPEEDDTWVSGALQRGKVSIFLGICSMYCHDLDSRSLALAILERTQELDDLVQEHHQEIAREWLQQQNRSYSDDGIVTKKPRVTQGGEQNDNVDNVMAQSSSLFLPPVAPPYALHTPPPRRIQHFLFGRGLKLLSRWLVDAADLIYKPPAAGPIKSGPVNPSNRQLHNNNKNHNSSSGSIGTTTATSCSNSRSSNNSNQPGDVKVPSSSQPPPPPPMSPLLLPLLQFLKRIPFDKKLVTQSKIHKEIRKLSKRVDAIVEDSTKSMTNKQQLKSRTGNQESTVEDPIFNGYPILQIQVAINELKQSWERRAKGQSALDGTEVSNSSVMDPFHNSLQFFHERAETLEKYHTGEIPRPEWLPPAPTTSSSATGSTLVIDARPSTEQMARRERENERAAMMKQDLKRAQQERANLLRKLREMKTRDESQTASTSAQRQRRTVRWKDGHGPHSRTRNRDVLEEVFTINVCEAESGSEEGTIAGCAEDGRRDDYYVEESR